MAVAGPRLSRQPPCESAVGHKGMIALFFWELSRGSSKPVVLGLLLIRATQCHTVPRGRGSSMYTGVCMLAYLHHTLRLGGMGLNVPTLYSGDVALGFPLPKKGQAVHGWSEKNRKK